MANPIEVSRRCAVTPSGTPIIAKATHANGNEKRLLISVRLALRSRWFSLFNWSSNCSIDNAERLGRDRKSTRLNSSHTVISYAVFCLKKKKKKRNVYGDAIKQRG